jgi:hypothetical protein
VEVDPFRDSQAIVLRDDSGKGGLVTEGLLARALGKLREPRLVVLNACSTEIMAAAVARVVPAVVGMRGEYSDVGAVALARSFYRELGRGAQLEQALADARRELNFSNPGSLDWSAPVLYLSGGACPLVATRTAPGPEMHGVRPDMPAPVEVLPAQTPRDAEREYLTARLNVDRRNAAALEAQAGQASTSLAPAMQSQLERLRTRIAETEAKLGVKGL